MSVIDEVRHERKCQRSRWGAQHDRNHSWWEWQGLMRLRLRLVEPHLAFKSDMDEASDVANRRRALIELAALAIAAIEANEPRSPSTAKP